MPDPAQGPAGEMRRSLLTGEWVVYAPARGGRPDARRREERRRPPAPGRVEDCPFCPGNEDRLPPTLMQSGGRESRQVRVVPNLYPGVRLDAMESMAAGGLLAQMPPWGAHEVIIETPRHDRTPAFMTCDEMAAVVDAYRTRYRTLAALVRTRSIVVFRNHGERAGTSLVHPHSQVIAAGVLPRRAKRRQRLAAGHYAATGQCLVCAAAAAERADRSRVVYENERFAAFVPFAAEVPFEVWIVPLDHRPDFGAITPEEITSFAAALQAVASVVHRRLGDPDYNYALLSDPVRRGPDDAFHWLLQLKPRLSVPAGFEMATGMHINPSLPERDAAHLRGTE